MSLTLMVRVLAPGEACNQLFTGPALEVLALSGALTAAPEQARALPAISNVISPAAILS